MDGRRAHHVPVVPLDYLAGADAVTALGQLSGRLPVPRNAEQPDPGDTVVPRRAPGSFRQLTAARGQFFAAWLGHTDAGFTMKTYVHARPEDLAVARDALTRKIIKE
jgi:hypothetical protein